jgi:hypothetical protein
LCERFLGRTRRGGALIQRRLGGGRGSQPPLQQQLNQCLDEWRGERRLSARRPTAGALHKRINVSNVDTRAVVTEVKTRWRGVYDRLHSVGAGDGDNGGNGGGAPYACNVLTYLVRSFAVMYAAAASSRRFTARRTVKCHMLVLGGES